MHAKKEQNSVLPKKKTPATCDAFPEVLKFNCYQFHKTLAEETLMLYLKENHLGRIQLEVRLDRVTHEGLLTVLKEARLQKSATQKFLICKAVAVRRREQAERLKENGVDTSDLERMIKRLETSMTAHKRAIGSAKDS